MPEVPRIAQPGDMFILLVPTGSDLERLHRAQAALQSQLGGQVIEPIHITVERLSPADGQATENCIETLRNNLLNAKPFHLVADALIQFFAPYWQNQVLRWRVQETPIWNQFRDQLEATLLQIRCPSHFTRRRHATCTILQIDRQVDLTSYQGNFPMQLFKVQEIWISLLKDSGKFEVVETLELHE